MAKRTSTKGLIIKEVMGGEGCINGTLTFLPFELLVGYSFHMSH